ncbi:hypothetical protein, partial [Stenotrophomonas maltophilia]|uniref:hypothetical protein n=1 Tax=Stenotrophomonas maltophilia TaxID=40324 RepID=UPI0039C16931
CRGQAPMDGFTASPANPTAPASDRFLQRPTPESTEEGKSKSKSKGKRGSLRSVDPRHAWMA